MTQRYWLSFKTEFLSKKWSEKLPQYLPNAWRNKSVHNKSKIEFTRRLLVTETWFHFQSKIFFFDCNLIYIGRFHFFLNKISFKRHKAFFYQSVRVPRMFECFVTAKRQGFEVPSLKWNKPRKRRWGQTCRRRRLDGRYLGRRRRSTSPRSQPAKRRQSRPRRPCQHFRSPEKKRSIGTEKLSGLDSFPLCRQPPDFNEQQYIWTFRHL